MRFLHIKNEQICFYCGGILLHGEEAVVITIKHENGYTIPQFFHTDNCFRTWNDETYVRRLLNWRMSAQDRPKKEKFKKKMGRPRKYKINNKARNLKALIFYHRKQEHDTSELERQLKELEI